MNSFTSSQQEINNISEDLDNNQSTYSSSHIQSTNNNNITKRIQIFQLFNPQHQHQTTLGLIKLDGNIQYDIVLQIHHKTIQKNKQIQTDPNQCPICKKQFFSPQAVGGHFSRTHPNESQKYQSKVAKREERKYQLLRTRQLQRIVLHDLELE